MEKYGRVVASYQSVAPSVVEKDVGAKLVMGGIVPGADAGTKHGRMTGEWLGHEA